MFRVAFFIALLCLFIWPRTFFISISGTGVSPFTISAVFMLIFALYLLATNRSVQSRVTVSLQSGTVAAVLTLLFWGWRFLSDIFGVNSGTSLKADSLELFYFGSWFVIGMIMFTEEGSSKTLQRVLTITIIVASLVALFEAVTSQSILTALGADNVMAGDAYRTNLATTITERDGAARLKSLFSHPIVFGSMMGALAPFAIHRFIHRSGAGLVTAIFLAISVVVSITLANARTSYVVVAVSMAAYAILYTVNLKRFSGIMIGTLLIVAAPLYVPAAILQVNEISSGRNTDESRSTQARAAQTNMAISAASTRLISGYGTGMALDVAGIQPEGRTFKTIDNYYLNMLVDYGYFGLAAFAALLVSYILLGVSAIHAASSPSDRSLLCVAVSAICGLSASFFAVSINDALSWIFLLAGFIIARKGSERLNVRSSFFVEQIQRRRAAASQAPSAIPAATPLGASPRHDGVEFYNYDE